MPKKKGISRTARATQASLAAREVKDSTSHQSTFTDRTDGPSAANCKSTQTPVPEESIDPQGDKYLLNALRKAHAEFGGKGQLSRQSILATYRNAAKYKEVSKEHSRVHKNLKRTVESKGKFKEANRQGKQESKELSSKFEKSLSEICQLKADLAELQRRIDSDEFKEQTARSYVVAHVMDGNKYSMEFRSNYAEFVQRCASARAAACCSSTPGRSWLGYHSDAQQIHSSLVQSCGGDCEPRRLALTDAPLWFEH
jgi:hypothetical protein